MDADTFVLRLASTFLAAFGTWAGAGLFLWMFRVRDATLRCVFWTWAVLAPLLVLAGLPGGGLVLLRLVVPADYPLFRDGRFTPSVLVVWTVVSAALIARRAIGELRLQRSIEGVARTSPCPSDLRDAVQRAASWLGVAPPLLAAAETDGTAFVAGVREPVLFMPLTLWRRLGVRERRAMLLHELAHIRRRDPLRLRALSYLLDVLWPALPLRFTAARLRDAWEAQADEEAVHGGATRTALAKSLVEAGRGPTPAGVLAFGGNGSTPQRLTALRGRPRAALLTFQILMLLWCVPWWPGPAGTGVNCRMERPDDDGHVGVLSIGFGSANPLVSAFQRPRRMPWIDGSPSRPSTEKP